MRAAAIISFLVLIYTGNLWADLSIRYVTITDNQKRPFNSVMIKQELVRINQVQESKPSVMIDLNSGDIVQLHPQSRRYFKINAQTLGQYVSIYQQNKTMFQGLIDHGIQQLDPQKRNQVQEWMQKFNTGSKNINNISIKPTGKKDSVLGVECTVLAMLNNGRLQREVCISDYKQLGLNPEDVQSLEQLKKFVHQFKQSAPQQHQELLSMVADGVSELKGIPLKMVNYHANGTIKNIVQAGSISFKSIPDQAYHIPQDYQQQQFPVL
jgi:hypothetical protein